MPDESSSSPSSRPTSTSSSSRTRSTTRSRPRRLERFLLVAWESGAAPLVVLTKADACPDLPAALEEAEAAALGAPVLALSVRTGLGLDELRARLAGSTAVLLGRSGAGKSTLVNALVGARGRRDRRGAPRRQGPAHDDAPRAARARRGRRADRHPRPARRAAARHGPGRRARVRRHRGARRSLPLQRLRPRRRARLRRRGGGRRGRALARALRGLAARRARPRLVRAALATLPLSASSGATTARRTARCGRPARSTGSERARCSDRALPCLAWPSPRPAPTSRTSQRAPPRATSSSRPISRTRPSPDGVDESSEESFPASDAPSTWSRGA